MTDNTKRPIDLSSANVNSEYAIKIDALKVFSVLGHAINTGAIKDLNGASAEVIIVNENGEDSFALNITDTNGTHEIRLDMEDAILRLLHEHADLFYENLTEQMILQQDKKVALSNFDIAKKAISFTVSEEKPPKDIVFIKKNGFYLIPSIYADTIGMADTMSETSVENTFISKENCKHWKKTQKSIVELAWENTNKDVMFKRPNVSEKQVIVTSKFINNVDIYNIPFWHLIFTQTVREYVNMNYPDGTLAISILPSEVLLTGESKGSNAKCMSIPVNVINHMSEIEPRLFYIPNDMNEDIEVYSVL